MTNKNSPNGNIEFDFDPESNKSMWTEFPGEEEVLLFPFFTFQVVKTTQFNKFCKIITLVEIPFQNNLDLGTKISQNSLIWLDNNPESFKNV